MTATDVYDPAYVPAGVTAEQHHADTLKALRAARSMSQRNREVGVQCNWMLDLIHHKLESDDVDGALRILNKRRTQINANVARKAQP